MRGGPGHRRDPVTVAVAWLLARMLLAFFCKNGKKGKIFSKNKSIIFSVFGILARGGPVHAALVQIAK